jgi:RNase H-like domain found in reverse transcriptase/Integrase zinc binding domain/Reverse transcriptase (RNA-dependent DNA polymerase)
MDLMSSYWQVRIRKEDQEKAAFVTSSGLYQPVRMPFGLVSAPSSFQRLADSVLASLTWGCALVYLDDIVAMGTTFESHLKNLDLILSRLEKHNLTLKPTKCAFAHNKVEILGHVASDKGIEPCQKKVEAMLKMPAPRSVHQIRSVLGMFGYYRKFIKNYAKITYPISQLLTKTSDKLWQPEHEKAFNELKERITNAPILTSYDPRAETEIHPDACDYGIGASLVQITEEDGKKVERPVAFCSRTMSKAEKNYSISEKEALAALYALKEFRPFLYGRRFTIITDHRALVWLKTCRDPINTRIARWALKLQEFDCDIKFRAGILNWDGDGLSRNPLDKLPEENEDLIEIPTFVLKKINKEPDKYKVHIFQKEDRFCQEIISRGDDRFIVVKGILYKKEFLTGKLLLVVPESMKHEILESYHGSILCGHLGYIRTLARIRERFYWPRLVRDVRRKCERCETCAMTKWRTSRLHGLLQPIPVNRPFGMVGIDILGPLPHTTGTNPDPKAKIKTINTSPAWCIVAQCYLTKYAITKALHSSTATEVAKFLVDSVICVFGCPETLVSDQGRQFESLVFTEINRILGIEQRFATAFHQQTNGAVERLNGTLCQMLSRYVDQETHLNWADSLPKVTFAYNASVHATTKETPFFLMFGRQPRFPMDGSLDLPAGDYHASEILSTMEIAWTIARDEIEKSQIQYKHRYDRSRTGKEYNVGDCVLLENSMKKIGLSPKLQPKYTGPYEVIEKLTPLNYKIRRLGSELLKSDKRRKDTQTVHIDRMKFFSPQAGQEGDGTNEDTNPGGKDLRAGREGPDSTAPKAKTRPAVVLPKRAPRSKIPHNDKSKGRLRPIEQPLPAVSTGPSVRSDTEPTTSGKSADPGPPEGLRRSKRIAAQAPK